MSEATVRQQWPITHRDCEGFTRRQQKNKAWGTAGGKLNFASRGTEGVRGLGDSWEAISLASYFLTADRGIGSWPQNNNRIFFLLHIWGLFISARVAFFIAKESKAKKHFQRIINRDADVHLRGAPLAIRDRRRSES